ncbi:MAG: LysM peptidoglycan-binding domain-containing protein [Actinomycetota bacterium]
MPVRHSYAGARPLAAVALAAASLVAAAAAGSILLSTARASAEALAAQGPASPADGILLVVGFVGALLSLWVGLSMALSALSALPGALGAACGEIAARIAPAAVRKTVAFILGTALTAAFVPGTAVARTTYQGPPRHAAVASAQYAVGALGNLADLAPDASLRVVSDIGRTSGSVHTNDSAQASTVTQAGDGADAAPGPSWSPEGHSPSEGHAAPETHPSADEARCGSVHIVVQRGDTLWSIAARHLGPAATTPEISAAWHRWFATNRQVIGDDPDVITPGQVLTPPAAQARS